MYDIIIVGAGPAGLTAALYATRARKKVLVLEALSYGGQIINTLEIDNYPVAPHISGFDFAEKLYNQVLELGVDFKFEKVIEIKNNKNYKEVVTKENTYQGKTLILATGSENRKLGLENRTVSASNVELPAIEIDYCKIGKKIDDFRNLSYHYIKESIK